jgi:opacity protein-like surface antigen
MTRVLLVPNANIIVLAIIWLMSVSSMCQAETAVNLEKSHFMQCIFNSSFWHPIVSASLGYSMNAKLGKSQFIPAENPSQDSYYDYQASQGSHPEAVFGLFIATETALKANWAMQLGINYSQPYSFDAKGNVTQGPVLSNGDPDFAAADTFQYKYHITSHQFLAQAKFLYNWHNKIHPYASFGLGTSYNRAFNYTANITPANTTLTNNFQNNAQWAFSYSVGTGVDVDIKHNWRLGVSYRFTDYGAAKTGNSIIDTAGTNNNGVFNSAVGSNKHLAVNHIYSHEVMTQLSFLVG